MTAEFRVGATVDLGSTYVVTQIAPGYYELFDGVTATVRPWVRATSVTLPVVVDAPDPGEVVARFRVGSVVDNFFSSSTWGDMTVTHIADSYFEVKYDQAGVEVTRVIPWSSTAFNSLTVLSDGGE